MYSVSPELSVHPAETEGTARPVGHPQRGLRQGSGVHACLPADSASLHVRMLGRELPKLISSMILTWSLLSESYAFVLTHSWDTKQPPGLSTRKISPYTSDSWTQQRRG